MASRSYVAKPYGRIAVRARDQTSVFQPTRYEDLRRTDDSWRLFEPELVRTLGMLPMEYLYFYYYRQQAVDHILRSGSTRGEQIATLNATLWPALRERVDAGDLDGAREAWERAIETRHETYFARERGEAVSEEPRAEPGRPVEMVEGDGYEGLATACGVQLFGSPP